MSIRNPHRPNVEMPAETFVERAAACTGLATGTDSADVLLAERSMR